MKIIKIITVFILSRLLYPIIKRIAFAVYYFFVVASIYLFHCLGCLFYFLEDKTKEYAESRRIIKGELSGDIGILRKFLKNSDVVTVKSIRDLGFSANKSVNIRKNLERFGLIKTNPQMDNRGQVVANQNQIDDILDNLMEDVHSTDPVLINA